MVRWTRSPNLMFPAKPRFGMLDVELKVEQYVLPGWNIDIVNSSSRTASALMHLLLVHLGFSSY